MQLNIGRKTYISKSSCRSVDSQVKSAALFQESGAGILCCMPMDFGVDMDEVREFLRNKAEKQRLSLDERFEHACRDFEEIAARVAAELNPLRIYQWGSLLDRRRISEISDIDIAVEGLNGPEEYFKAVGIAMEMTSFPVDVVEMEKIPAGTAERIRKKGRVVYERKNP